MANKKTTTVPAAVRREKGELAALLSNPNQIRQASQMIVIAVSMMEQQKPDEYDIEATEAYKKLKKQLGGTVTKYAFAVNDLIEETTNHRNKLADRVQAATFIRDSMGAKPVELKAVATFETKYSHLSDEEIEKQIKEEKL